MQSPPLMGEAGEGEKNRDIKEYLMFSFSKIRQIFYLFFTLFLFVLSINLRSPLFFKLRYYDLAFVLAGSGLLIIIIILEKKRINYSLKLFLISMILLSAAFVIGVYTELRFQYVKYKVLSTDSSLLCKYGDHFIAGYDDVDELAILAKKGAISGIFIAAKNVKNKKITAIKKLVSSLQLKRNRQGLPGLFITTDQEGGSVSRISPPLKYMPTLSTVYRDKSNKDAVKQYAKEKALLLKSAGVNVNFSPVVDLKFKHPVNMLNLHTLIWLRAISHDPEIVTKAALQYCKSLNEQQMIPVLKHFPGLGRISGDTHFFTASLNNSVQELYNLDWLPYRKIPKQARAFIMLGHVKLNRVDSEYPASYSEKVVSNIIRKRLNFKGVLITDDFSMGPIFYAWEPMSEITIKAINAGVDLILVSYDYDLFYYIMYDLIYNKKGDDIIKDKLINSNKRLDKARAFLFGN